MERTVKSLIICTAALLMYSCAGNIPFTRSARWQMDEKSGHVYDLDNRVYWHFEDDVAFIQNSCDCSSGKPHFVRADDWKDYRGRKWMTDILQDMPFRPDSVGFVYADQYLVVETALPVDLAPDYEIHTDSALYLMRGEVFHPDRIQRADVIWRNLVFNRRAGRILCIDRFHIGNRHMALVYVLQSKGKALRRAGIGDWYCFPSWDVTDPHNLMSTGNTLDYYENLSIDILNHHSLPR